MVYHLITPAQWEKWSDSDHYESPAFGEEGFIHLCTANQLAGVHERYYSHEKALLLLLIDPELLVSELKWETATNNELFPHLYGSINKSAILQVTTPKF